VTKERLERLNHDKTFQALKVDDREVILNALDQLPDRKFTNRDTFLDELTDALATLEFKMAAPVKKSILAALSERDPSADVCRDSKGNREPDKELRDHELVPLKENWREYFDREVRTFAEDAWVDEKHRDTRDKDIGRVGYEINFNRFFKPYMNPRPLEIIDSDIFAILESLSKSIESLRV
jgi:type I restriction enzyme M protein